MTVNNKQSIWTWNPRLRVSRQLQGGETVYVVQNPATDDNFQIGEAEYLVAQCFDGSKELADVQTKLANAGDEFDLDELEAFCRAVGGSRAAGAA